MNLREPHGWDDARGIPLYLTPDGKPWPAPESQDFVQVLSEHAKVLVAIHDCQVEGCVCSEFRPREDEEWCECGHAEADHGATEAVPISEFRPTLAIRWSLPESKEPSEEGS